MILLVGPPVLVEVGQATDPVVVGDSPTKHIQLKLDQGLANQRHGDSHLERHQQQIYIVLQQERLHGMQQV